MLRYVVYGALGRLSDAGRPHWHHSNTLFMQHAVPRRRALSRASHPLFLATVLAALAGCQDQLAPTAPTAPTRSVAPDLRHVVGSQRQSLDDRLALVDSAAPGFGGMYLDDAGTLVVRSSRTGAKDAIRAALQQLMPGALRERPDFRVEPARYSFGELRKFRRQLLAEINRQELGREIVFVDVDERTNQVVFGVPDAATKNRALAAISAAGVAEDARDVVISPVPKAMQPVSYNQDIRGVVRPVVGGVQLGIVVGGGFVRGCTSGFVATNGFGQRIVVTNSHCTNNPMNLQGWNAAVTRIDQPMQYLSYGFLQNHRINLGDYPHDPMPTSYVGSCATDYPGYTCRYSDAAAAVIADSVSAQRGYLAKLQVTNPTIVQDPVTLQWDADSTLAANGARWTISRAAADPWNEPQLPGQPVMRTGRSLGQRTGTIDRGCVDLTAGFSGSVRLLCQTTVFAAVYCGDSGGPVFRVNEDGNVTLLGIMWGGSGQCVQTTSSNPYYGNFLVFSGIWNVRADLDSYWDWQVTP